ncbi:MAG TPA: DUF5658 family protein [Vicinamibacterales bacterium]|nr:DUF5658 family protein [Vicinamibacterales bacterium]
MSSSAASASSLPGTVTSRPRTRFGDVVLALFLCAQILDGVFTYLGISNFGWTEGNPLIAWYMHRFGLVPSLTGAKLMAVLCAVILHVLGYHKSLGVLTLLYLAVAILPWTFVIFVLH